MIYMEYRILRAAISPRDSSVSKLSCPHFVHEETEHRDVHGGAGI